ncbi:MAG: tetratricopeptide repeat protein [Gammaproteobacteria bacterium]|nr:tetratricopeptide repeat protein [Gammaproteobacteria bacterium]
MKLTHALSTYKPNCCFPALFTLLLLLGGCGQQPSTGGLSDADIRVNNQAVALMGRFEYQAASERFAELLERNPNRPELRTNYAIALKNRQQPGDAERALEQLNSVLANDPENVRANYNAGVLQLYLGQVEPAAAYFKAALATDPDDAYANYYLGQCHLRMDDEAAALNSYQAAIDADPYLRSAYYSAAQVLRKLGRSEEANQQLALFQRFENNPAARLAEFKYTRMGPKSLAIVLGERSDSTLVAALPAGPLFDEARVLATAPRTAVHGHLSTVDLNQDNRQDLFLIGGEGAPNRVMLAHQDGQFIELKDHPWKSTEQVNAVAWGDVNNDGLVDGYFCRNGKNQLWLQGEPGQWQLAGPQANVSDGEKDCADAVLVDADHDGDLDILIGNRGAADNLLNNNRDGSFRSLVEKLGTAAEAANTRHLITTDIDGDDDVDLIFVRETAPHTVLINDRLWNYNPAANMESFINTPVRALSAADLDADGQIELIGLGEQGELVIWQSDINSQWQSQSVQKTELDASATVQLVPLDIDGSGRLELLALGEGSFKFFAIRPATSRLADDKRWKAEQIMQQQFVGGMPLPIILSERGYSMVATRHKEAATELAEWAPGPGRHAFVTLTLSGKHDAAETMRSNRSGIGSKVSLRSGSRWTITDTYKHSSAPGFSLQPLAIGLGGAAEADFIAVEWSDGVYQTELNLPGNGLHTVAEEQRQLGSCPVLFAWTGEKFDFVTDILGVAAQGFLVEPGVLMPPRPWEKVFFPPDSLAGRDGYIQFKVTEPMEENSYIDQLILSSYDLPEDWQIVVDERMATGAPEVTGDTLFFREFQTPVAARDKQGADVLRAIVEHDQVAMPAGEIDRRYIGLLKQPAELILEFDQPIHRSPDLRPYLVAEAWVELPYSQTHFSAWQAGNHYRAVSLDARDANGEWRTIHPEFGMPGGMPRVISVPLDAVPQDAVAVRLRWNREMYWDRLRVIYAENPPTQLRQRTNTPAVARVVKSGFYQRVNHAQRRPEYIYQQRRPFGDVKYPTGMYTSLGEMTELVSSADDALAIIGPGEEIHVNFTEPSAPAEGLRRWYVLETRGWAKDKDLYTYQGDTVGPLPIAYPDADTDRRDALHKKYNTRFQSGR